MAASKYVVVDGTQVHHDGVTYASGETVPVTNDQQVAYLLNAGWIEPAPRARKG